MSMGQSLSSSRLVSTSGYLDGWLISGLCADGLLGEAGGFGSKARTASAMEIMGRKLPSTISNNERLLVVVGYSEAAIPLPASLCHSAPLPECPRRGRTYRPRLANKAARWLGSTISGAVPVSCNRPTICACPDFPYASSPVDQCRVGVGARIRPHYGKPDWPRNGLRRNPGTIAPPCFFS